MDAHCLWINNCVGLGNHKYYINFLVYSFLTAASTVFLMVDGLYCLLAVPNQAKTSWKNAHFWPAVAVCLLAAYLGFYFFNHLQLLIVE